MSTLREEFKKAFNGFEFANYKDPSARIADWWLKKLREKVTALKEKTAEVQGTNKYDSCYDDVLNILK